MDRRRDSEGGGDRGQRRDRKKKARREIIFKIMIKRKERGRQEKEERLR